MEKITNYTGQVFDTVEDRDAWERKEVAYLTAQHRRTIALIGDPVPFKNESIRYRPGHVNSYLTSGD